MGMRKGGGRGCTSRTEESRGIAPLIWKHQTSEDEVGCLPVTRCQGRIWVRMNSIPSYRTALIVSPCNLQRHLFCHTLFMILVSPILFEWPACLPACLPTCLTTCLPTCLPFLGKLYSLNGSILKYDIDSLHAPYFLPMLLAPSMIPPTFSDDFERSH